MTELAMRSKAHWGYSAEFMAACREELTVPAARIGDSCFHYLVAELDSEVVGFCGLERLNAVEFELEGLFVEPAAMGTGIGAALLTRAKDLTGEAGARSLLIQSDPNAEGFYAANGAQWVCTSESGSIPGRFLPVYRIRLSTPAGC